MTTIKDMAPLSEVKSGEKHISIVLNNFSRVWTEKYLAGQKEHSGKLWRKPVFAFLVEEVVDLVSYVWVLAPQLARVEELLSEAITDGDDRKVLGALNILRFGNEEGVPEEER